MLYGRGLTSYIEWTGGRAHNEKVCLHATGEGRVILHSGTMAMGQGLQTTYTQMVSDALGIAMDKIDVVQGDTDLATGFGSVGSRSLFVGGTAVAVSTNDLITKAREKAVEPAGGLGRGHRISRRLAHRGRHRPPRQPVRDREEGRRRGSSRSTARARSTGRAGRTARISARSRSIRRPASPRWCATPRSMTSASPSIRCW